MNNRLLQELWHLADGYPREQGESRDGAFGPIGLFLDRSLERGGYNSTPANTRMFARTGGDGVHYSFLVSDDGIVRDDCPVVMTVPMSDEPNLIVGENLLDFLALGMRFGFFPLEQITYQHDEFFAGYQGDTAAFDFTLDEEQAAMLALIAKVFGVLPWRDAHARFERLLALAVRLQPAPEPESP